MHKLAPKFTVAEMDFHLAWAKAVRLCYKHGIDIVFGSTDEPKKARDAVIEIILTGDAISQIQKREIHPNFPFKSIGQYCDEYTREFLEKYVKIPDNDDKKFAYLYFERLAHYEGADGTIVDQLAVLRNQMAEQIETGIMSNRSQMVTWQRKKDDYSVSPPCLQRIWQRFYPPKYIDVHLSWRSRDLIYAWQANIICVIEMLNREVYEPLGLEIMRIDDFNDSLHIYEASLPIAEKIPISPQFANM